MQSESTWKRLGEALASTVLCCVVGVSVADTRTSVEAGLDDAVESGKVLSGYGAIVQDGEIRFFGARRLAPEQDAAPDASTSYQIGSISKAFTNLLLAEMVAAGTVQYDTSLAELLGGEIDFANPSVGEITLLQLATHTSGLPRLPPNLGTGDPADPYADYGESELLAALAAAREGQPLADRYAYSNFGVGLLGYLLGRVHGGGYPAALESMVLEPLQLDETGLEPRTKAAAAYAGDDAVPAWGFDALAGAGALWSTAGDMARLARVQLGLESSTLEHETATGRDVVAPAAGGNAVSRVWHVAETEEGPVYWHNGATAGNRSFLGFRPATGEAVVLLASGEMDPADRAMDWFGVASAPADGPVLEPGLAGQYRLTPQLGIGVYERDSRPVAQVSGQPPAPMIPVGDDWYAINVADASLQFLREDGEVTGVKLVQNGRVQRAEKVADSASVLARRAVEMDRATLEQYTGEYALGPGARFTIRLGKEGLETRLTGQPFLRIHPKGGDVFFYKAVDAELHFERDAEGKVTALVLHQGGMEQRAERVE